MTSELIRKITGIGGPEQVNYIPVVYYCDCGTAATSQIKYAKWIGSSEGNTADPIEFDLYSGMAIAVLFRNGFDLEDQDVINANISEFTLQIGSRTEPKRMILTGENSVLKKVREKEVIFFIYDGEVFRVSNGITGAQFDDIAAELISSIANLQDMVVLKGGENNDEALTGYEDQPVYVSNSQVTPINLTIGSETNPIWLNQGHITATTATVGDQNFTNVPSANPVYLNNGSITALTVTVGSGVNPIYMKDGSIVGSTDTVGSELYGVSGAGKFQPVFLKSGNITAATVQIGSSSNPIWMDSNGTLCRSDYSAGSTTTIIYMEDGNIKQSAATVGGHATTTSFLPVYLNQGTVTPATLTIGDDVKPLKMVNGSFVPVTSNLATQASLTAAVDALTTTIAALPNNYHTGGTYTFAASSQDTGLKTTVPGDGTIQSITLTMPIFWGTNEPSMSGATVPVGSLYIQLDADE